MVMPGSRNILVDSTTDMITLDGESLAELVNRQLGAIGIWPIRCLSSSTIATIPSKPNLLAEAWGKNLTLRAEDYTFEVMDFDESDKLCVLTIRGSPDRMVRSEVVIRNRLLRNYYTVFDYARGMIGLADTK